MDTETFAKRLVIRLRKRAEEYKEMSKRHNPQISPNDIISDEATATALSETADIVEETLSSFDE